MINRLLIFFMLIGTALTMKAQDTASVEVYPNPFCENVYVTYNLPAEDSVRLTVYDRFGFEVKSYFNSSQNAGEYTVIFTADTLLAGIYIFRFTYGDSTVIAKNLLKTTDCNTTDISSPSLTHLQVYPNPTDKFLAIPIQGYKQIIITNMQGQVCKQFKAFEDIIDVSDLPEGLYAVNVIDEHGKLMLSEKLVKH